jgi:5,10-methylenetetrahydromethanopterin reductase
MRQSVLDLKRIMAGEDVSYNGVTSRMNYGDAEAPPVYISATGPRTIEVAGEVADGVVLSVGVHPKAVALAREHLTQGAKRAGRNPDEVELVLCASIVLHDDLKEAREMARPFCVNWMIEEYNARWLRAMGFDLRGLELPKELWDLYPDVLHAEDWEKAKRLCAFLPDDLLAQICDAIGFIGTPEHCARRLRETEAAGLGHLYLRTSDTYKFAHRELESFRDVIFPALASAK